MTIEGIQYRVCGCAWRIVPFVEVPEYARRMPAGLTAPPFAARFVTRCSEHGVMCRSLEDWEHEMFDGTRTLAEIREERPPLGELRRG